MKFDMGGENYHCSLVNVGDYCFLPCSVVENSLDIHWFVCYSKLTYILADAVDFARNWVSDCNCHSLTRSLMVC